LEEKQIKLFFFNLKHFLQLIKRYEIILDEIELIILCQKIIDLYSNREEAFFSKELLDSEFRLEYFFIFYESYKFRSENLDNLDIIPEIIQKDKFLSFMFGINHLDNKRVQKCLSERKLEIQKENFHDMLQSIKNFEISSLLINQVRNYSDLIKSSLKSYVFKRVILIQFQINEEKREFSCEIKMLNRSNYIFKDFEYKISWKPKKRINLISAEEIHKGMDLHQILQRKYSFIPLTNGKVSFYCKVSFKNPLGGDDFIKKQILLKTYDI
jgi:hypothetical protein